MSRRERQMRRRHGRGHSGARTGLVTALVLLSAVGIAIAGAVGWVVSVAHSANLNELKPISPGSNSVVYTHDGKRLGFINSLILRTPAPASAIPDKLERATVAIEDRRFYEHQGIDYEGVIRAAVRNITSKRTVQGGSTLTMQLVRNIYLPDERSNKSFVRKIREAKLAAELEKRHPGRKGKHWILVQYLNSVPYGTVGGQTAVGVQAAARMFFDKPANKLTLAQAALLAGLPQAPSEYNPFLDPQAALSRRAEVLNAMVKSRDITPAQARAASQAPLGVKHNRYYTTRREQFFFDYVTGELFRRYGVKRVRQGGLKIYTTVDLGLQKRARQAIAGRLSQPGDPSSSIVTIDPSNGHIVAMASSATYGKTKFDYATQAHRQPGSTFKVMVLMAALRLGMNPQSTTFVSRQLNPGWLPGYPEYGVSTFEHTYGGSMNLVKATLKSDNTVFAQLDAEVGPKAVRKAAYDMGIKTKLDALPAEGLGGLKYGVSPLEMADAYATIASGGVRHQPVAILKVVHPNGKVDRFGNSKGKREFPDGITAEITKILHQNIQSGTGVNANIQCPAAGKTGTTEDFKDAWFVGFTPRLTTAVWVGYPNPPVPMRSVHGIEVQGGSFPAQIWHDFMTTAVAGHCENFKPPTHPFQPHAFFGHYSRTGSSSGRQGTGTGYSNGYRSYNRGYSPPAYSYPTPTPSATPSPSPNPTPSPGTGGGGAGAGAGAGAGTGGTGGGGGSSNSSKYNDPSLYASPPTSSGGGSHGR